MIEDTDITEERLYRLKLLEGLCGYTLEHIRSVCTTVEEMDHILEGHLESLAGTLRIKKLYNVTNATLMLRQHHKDELERTAKRKHAEESEKAPPGEG